jgi:predicted nucleic acid-binding protein
LRAYADASFLASLYVFDNHAYPALSQIEKIQTAGHTILVSDLASFETNNAIHLAIFRKLLSREGAANAMARSLADVETGVFRRIVLPEATWTTARQLSQMHAASTGYRSLDILHAAIALCLNSDQFLTFDQRQRNLAVAAGLDAPDLLAFYS